MFLSHTIVVSRWFVIPIAATCSAVIFNLLIASTATPSIDDHISSASCSTHPGCGKYCVNSFCATLQITPCSLNKIQRLLVVPPSNAITYFFITLRPPITFFTLSKTTFFYFLSYHKKGSAGIYLPSEPLKDYNKLLFLFFYDRSEFFPRNINFCAFIDDRIYMH